MQNGDNALPNICPAGRGQMLITLELHGYILIKFCIPVHFNIV